MWETHWRPLFWCVVLGALLGHFLIGSWLVAYQLHSWLGGALFIVVLCWRPFKDPANRLIDRWMER